MASFFDTPEQIGIGGIHEGCKVRIDRLMDENLKLKRERNLLRLFIVQIILIAAITIGAMYSKKTYAAAEQAGVAQGIPSNIQVHPARPGWSKVPEPQTEPSKPAPVVSNAVVPKSRRFLGIDYSYWWIATLIVAVGLVWFQSDSTVDKIKPKDQQK